MLGGNVILRAILHSIHLNLQWRKKYISTELIGGFAVGFFFPPFVLASSEIFSYHNNTR